MAADWYQIADDMESYASQEATNKSYLTTAKDYLDTKISDLTAFRDEIIGTYPDAAAFVNEHINKSVGIFGTLGLVAGAASMLKGSTTSSNNKVMATYLAEIYRAKAKGTSLADLSTAPAIPGGTTSSDPNARPPDFIFANRTDFPPVKGVGEDPYVIGSMICVNGFMYVYVDPVVSGSTYQLTNGWAKINYLLI